MYICVSLFTLVHLHGCSENCKPILARNNLEITDEHSIEFERILKLGLNKFIHYMYLVM